VDTGREVPDEGLVRRAMAGNAEAFGDLYMACLDRVYRYVLYRVGDVHLAEDLTETTFLRAWEAHGRYKLGRVPVLGWLYRIAHNAVIDYFRSAHPHEELSPALPAPGGDIETGIAQQEEIRDLAKALRRLDEVSQEVLSLRFIAGLSHREVAQLLGRSEEAVRVIQFRAVRRMRELMQGGQNNGK